MDHHPVGPACGNNPHFKLSTGDRQAVEEFKAYLGARAERRSQYEEAVRTAGDTAYGNMPFCDAIIKAVLAVADAEQASLLARIAELEAAERPAVLTDSERQFLTFALDLAADQMASRGDEFDGDDEAALKTFRRMADEAQQNGGQL